MERVPPVPSPEAIALLSSVLRSVARRRLGPDEAADFVQSAELRLFERGYDVLTRFAGRSSLRTYLHVVAARLLLDWRNATYGKWRPSASARRFGPVGVFLDRLVSRDGCTIGEAVEIARARWPHIPAASLVEMSERLPAHPPRRVARRELREDVAVCEFDDPVLRREAEETALRRHRAVAHAVRTLPAQEREMLRARYADGRTVRAIAETMGVEPKDLYRRFDRVLVGLRRTLVEHVADSRAAS